MNPPARGAIRDYFVEKHLGYSFWSVEWWLTDNEIDELHSEGRYQCLLCGALFETFSTQHKDDMQVIEAHLQLQHGDCPECSKLNLDCKEHRLKVAMSQ